LYPPSGNATEAYLAARATATIPDFVNVPQLDMVTALIHDPRVHGVLTQVFGGSNYRFTSHNDVCLCYVTVWCPFNTLAIAVALGVVAFMVSAQ
jgi:hypothetical protein